jgi:hypothetical protein
MAESKFAGIFQHGLTEEPTVAERTEKRTAALKVPGRPPGKRSDPEYKQYSVLLKKQTHRQVTTILREREDSPSGRFRTAPAAVRAMVRKAAKIVIL